MENMSGKARLVFILFCCVVAANIFWFLFRWTDDTVYEGPEEPDGGYTELLEDSKDLIKSLKKSPQMNISLKILMIFIMIS